MSPEELAARHPRLYHLTAPGAYESIARHGLLPASQLLRLFGHKPGPIETRRRASDVVLTHPVHGRAVINDNLPLSEAALAACLDDGLAPADWLAMLNARVFFWADEAGLRSLLNARRNKRRARDVLVFDTLRLARACAPGIDLSPINSGATLRRPARRGLSTFTPMTALSYDAWRRLRGRADTVREVSVRGAVDDVESMILDIRRVPAAGD